MARAFEPYDLMWLEDALPPEDYEGWRRLSAAAPMPLATGERDWTIEDYRHRLDYRPGGHRARRPGPGRGRHRHVADRGRRGRGRGVAVVPHSWSSALNTAAALHVLATCATTTTFELKPHPSPMQHELVAEPFDMVDGLVHGARTARA